MDWTTRMDQNGTNGWQGGSFTNGQTNAGWGSQQSDHNLSQSHHGLEYQANFLTPDLDYSTSAGSPHTTGLSSSGGSRDRLQTPMFSGLDELAMAAPGFSWSQGLDSSQKRQDALKALDQASRLTGSSDSQNSYLFNASTLSAALPLSLRETYPSADADADGESDEGLDATQPSSPHPPPPFSQQTTAETSQLSAQSYAAFDARAILPTTRIPDKGLPRSLSALSDVTLKNPPPGVSGDPYTRKLASAKLASNPLPKSDARSAYEEQAAQHWSAQDLTVNPVWSPLPPLPQANTARSLHFRTHPGVRYAGSDAGRIVERVQPSRRREVSADPVVPEFIPLSRSAAAVADPAAASALTAPTAAAASRPPSVPPIRSNGATPSDGNAFSFNTSTSLRSVPRRTVQPPRNMLMYGYGRDSDIELGFEDDDGDEDYAEDDWPYDAGEWDDGDGDEAEYRPEGEAASATSSRSQKGRAGSGGGASKKRKLSSGDGACGGGQRKSPADKKKRKSSDKGGGASSSGPASKRHICQECGKGFDRAFNLSQHMQATHLGIRQFICPIETCKREFNRKNDRARHCRTVHRDLNIDLTIL